ALALRLICCGAFVGSASLPLTAAAQTATVHHFDIPAGPLATALNQAGETAGVLLSFEPAVVSGKQSNGLRGSYSAQEGLTRLLEGSGLELLPRRDGGYTVRAPAAAMLPAVQVSAGLHSPLASRQEQGYRN